MSLYLHNELTASWTAILFSLFFDKKKKNWWWIGAWRHGLVGFRRLVCLFLFLYSGRRVVLSADVLWRFISQQSTCKRNMWNVVNKYRSINKVDVQLCPAVYLCVGCREFSLHSNFTCCHVEDISVSFQQLGPRQAAVTILLKSLSERQIRLEMASGAARKWKCQISSHLKAVKKKSDVPP